MNPDTHMVIEQEADRPNVRFVLGVAVVTLVVFSVGIAWSVMLVHAETHRIRPSPAPIPPMIGHSTIGIVEQAMFEGDRKLADMIHKERRRLESYGWSDRERSRIHIPIETAMKQVAEGARP